MTALLIGFATFVLIQMYLNYRFLMMIKYRDNHMKAFLMATDAALTTQAMAITMLRARLEPATKKEALH